MYSERGKFRRVGQFIWGWGVIYNFLSSLVFPLNCINCSKTSRTHQSQGVAKLWHIELMQICWQCFTPSHSETLINVIIIENNQ